MDTSTIEGYSEMTAEEKVAALEGYEFDYKGYVKKEQFDKVASEAAENKRKLNASLSEEEKRKAERDEELESLRSQLAEVTRTNVLSSHTRNLTELGFDTKLATETATAIADGDTGKLFANLTKYKDTLTKELKAELLKNVPTPPAGKGNDTMTIDKLKSMSPADRYKYSQENPDEYKKLYGV